MARGRGPRCCPPRPGPALSPPGAFLPGAARGRPAQGRPSSCPDLPPPPLRSAHCRLAKRRRTAAARGRARGPSGRPRPAPRTPGRAGQVRDAGTGRSRRGSLWRLSSTALGRRVCEGRRSLGSSSGGGEKRPRRTARAKPAASPRVLSVRAWGAASPRGLKCPHARGQGAGPLPAQVPYRRPRERAAARARCAPRGGHGAPRPRAPCRVLASGERIEGKTHRPRPSRPGRDPSARRGPALHA